MEKVAVLVAMGPNNVEIPCRLFPNIKTGETRCNEIFGFAGKNRGDEIWWNTSLDVGPDGGENEERISDTLFTRWYYGCGSPYRFILKYVEFDAKFTMFDLD